MRQKSFLGLILTLACCTGLLSAAWWIVPTEPPATARGIVSPEPPATTTSRVTGKVERPVAVHRVQPVCSASEVRTAEPLSLEGVVRKDGGVDDIKILSGPVDDLASRVVAALEQWRYRPGTLNGRPMDVILTYTVKRCVIEDSL